MYLKRLEMIGFKSFADKTTLYFEPGITTVVGPNGCGKSNIFDAIRWILGEQSIKSLRGTKMEDVIFNGTDIKPALSFAEASLTFTNKERFLPIQQDEVVITRRLYRSGESEYLINKMPVRLKDINELFMGTGITAESYSLVEQGKVDLVISSKPEDRRLIFDEAAGITKYKAKKKEAMNKLRDTEDNLLRINDIITEVKRQINSIERQAKKAQRYKEEMEKLKDLEIKMAKFQLSALEREKEELDTKVKKSKQKQLEYSKMIEESTKRLEDKRLVFKDSQEEINRLNANIINLDNMIERNQQLIRLNRERIQEEGQRKNRLNQQREHLSRIIQEQKQKIKNLETEINSLKKVKETKSSEINANKNLLEKLTELIKQSQESITKAKMEILELSRMQTKVKNEITDVNSHLHSLLARKKRLDLEKNKVTSEKDTIDDKFQKLSNEFNEVYQKLQRIKAHRIELEIFLETLRKQLDQLKEEIVDLNNRKLALVSQREFIEKLRLKYEDIPSAGRSIILSEHRPAEASGVFLGKIREIIDLDQKTKSVLKKYLKDTGIVDFCRIESDTKFISLDLKRLDRKIDELAYKIRMKGQQEKSTLNDIQNKEAEIEYIDEDFRKQEIILSNIQTQKDTVQAQLNKLQEELDLVAMELSETISDLEDYQKKENKLNEHSKALEEDRYRLEVEIENNQNLISSKTREREEISIIIAQLETELTSLRDKEITQNETLKMLNDTLRRGENDFASIEDEKKNSAEKSEELNQQIIRMEKEIQTAHLQKDQLQNNLVEIEENNRSLIDDIEKTENDLKNISQSLEKEKQYLHELLMKEQELSFKRNSIKERILQTHKVNIDNIDTEIASDLINLQELNNQITDIKAKIDKFGTVNLVAIEEHQELKQRFEFLTKQQEDLIASKESLHNTINKINRTARKLFIETFENVAREFRNYFKLLFGGGDAQLLLIDPHNVLESGIEIIARPPGKKLQSISLLSGGEKALTAISLIFGVFKVKPSPFCILDEIDAPLDDSNVDRFAKLLKEFTKTSQFIIITHNKKTIINADIMYGITMQETGISKIVSVKFANDKESKEPVPVAV
jgi:chromosome segregation protein